MQVPNFSYSFIFELDACDYGIGCVLNQEYDNKKVVIAYARRTLTLAERKYSAVEREALAIVWATKHFRQYLEGGPVIVSSDCKVLQWLQTARDPTGRLARWAMKLFAYHLVIQHRPDSKNPNDDFMSRYPLPPASANSAEINSLESRLNTLNDTNLLDDIRAAQLADPRLARIMQSLTIHPPQSFNSKDTPYILINNTLYKIRHLNSYSDQRLLGTKYLLVIPPLVSTQVLTISPRPSRRFTACLPVYTGPQ
ncbi:unnamed protein product [Rotaria magnacalcarata]|uniref:Reverse transcriptase RNase H-like domain-containing protein n=1 Tax=Rotaria magnacalcarata TaxID=392030 RepID=A0A816RK35_9BILA|nr:unnamed protein product [Rotaria magnacalcarata]